MKVLSESSAARPRAGWGGGPSRNLKFEIASNSSCQTASERTILAFPSISCVGAGSCMSGHICVYERYIQDEAGQNPKTLGLCRFLVTRRLISTASNLRICYQVGRGCGPKTMSLCTKSARRTPARQDVSAKNSSKIYAQDERARSKNDEPVHVFGCHTPARLCIKT